MNRISSLVALRPELRDEDQSNLMRRAARNNEKVRCGTIWVVKDFYIATY